MRPHSRIAASTAIAGVILLLAACAGPPSVADRVERGLPESLSDAERATITWEEPSVVWLDEGRRFALITWGSSSCRPTVTAMDALAADEVELRLVPPDTTGPCTADMAAITHELTLPDEVTDRPVIVVITFPEGDQRIELLLD